MSIRTDGAISNAAGTGPVTLTKQWASKSWASINGTGTVAVRDGENVSSITDNGAGDYSINFSSAMVNTGYSISALTNREASDGDAQIVTLKGQVSTAPTVNRFILTSRDRGAGTLTDVSWLNATVHGDLA